MESFQTEKIVSKFYRVPIKKSKIVFYQHISEKKVIFRNFKIYILQGNISITIQFSKNNKLLHKTRFQYSILAFSVP